MHKIDFYGSIWSSDSRRVKEYLDLHEVKYNFIDVEVEDDQLIRFQKDQQKKIVPTLFIDNIALIKPSNATIKLALQLREKSLADQRGFTCGIERPSYEIGDECDY